jgi:hypothetical protein
MSDADNEVSNANGKRTNALQLGPRKKAYVFLLHVLHCSDKAYQLHYRSACPSWPSFLSDSTRYVQYSCVADQWRVA